MLALFKRKYLVPLLFLGLAACSSDSAVTQTQPSPADVSAQAVNTVVVAIQPAQPTSDDCLQVIFQGQPDTPDYQWEVNGQQVVASRPDELCNEYFKRGDRVSVQVGSGDAGGSASVVIGNSLPRVTGISTKPKELFAGTDIEILPVSEDRDGDPVEFRYQWLINGEVDAFVTEAKLPGNRFTRGDTLQVKITPFDGEGDGLVYSSYVTSIPNSPPVITSRPPEKFESLVYSYQVAARDPDDVILTYQLIQSPTGMAISPAGLVTWPLRGIEAGSYPVKVVVKDSIGAEAAQEFTLTLGLPSGHNP